MSEAASVPLRGSTPAVVVEVGLDGDEGDEAVGEYGVEASSDLASKTGAGGG